MRKRRYIASYFYDVSHNKWKLKKSEKMQRYIKNRKKRNDVINIINRCIIIKIKKKTYKRKRQKNLLEVYTDKENVKYISDVCIEQLVFTKRGR